MTNDPVIPGAEDLAFYRKNGYWVSPKIISDERLEELRLHMDKVFNGDFETGRAPWSYWQGEPGLRQTNNAYWADHTIRALATDRTIGAIAAALMETNKVRVWHDQLLYKPGSVAANNNANVGWHQDYVYWQCADRPAFTTAWIAFDDVNLENGCMQIVPGSHEWGLINVNDFYERDLQKQQDEMKLLGDQAFKPVPLVMKAGQVSFHHALTLHGSGPNTTSAPRRSLTIHLMAGGTRYKAGTTCDGHSSVQLAQPKDGDEFAGEWFPVAYSAE